jgi:hypothetical protein
LICRVHVFSLFRALRPFTKKRGDCGRPVGVVFSPSDTDGVGRTK